MMLYIGYNKKYIACIKVYIVYIKKKPDVIYIGFLLIDVDFIYSLYQPQLQMQHHQNYHFDHLMVQHQL